jgi:hypothetical protein
MNYLGQLGLLDTFQRLSPVKVRKSQPGQLFIAFIAAGTFEIKASLTVKQRRYAFLMKLRVL